MTISTTSPKINSRKTTVSEVNMSVVVLSLSEYAPENWPLFSVLFFAALFWCNTDVNSHVVFSLLFVLCPGLTPLVLLGYGTGYKEIWNIIKRDFRYSKFETLLLAHNWHWVSRMGTNVKINILVTHPVSSANVNRKNVFPTFF